MDDGRQSTKDGSRKAEVGRRRSEVESWKSEVGSRNFLRRRFGQIRNFGLPVRFGPDYDARRLQAWDVMAIRSHTSEDPRSIIRQLKILVALLIISNIALGVFGFWLLRNIDRNYSALIDQSVPTLTRLQNLTAAASETMRSTNPVLLDHPDAQPSEIARAARDTIGHDTELRQELLSRDWVKNAQSGQTDIRAAGEAFDRAAADTVQLLEANQITEAQKHRETVLRPAYNRYVTVTSQASQSLRTSSLRESNSLTLHVASVSKMILGIASWPLIILGAFLLFVLLFVISVLIKVTLFKEEIA